MQLAVVCIGRVAPDAIDRDSQQLGIVALEFFKNFVVEGKLIAADGTPVGRIERQDDGAATKFGQSDFLVGRAVQLKRWSGGSRRQSVLPVLLADCAVNGLGGAMLFFSMTVRFVRLHVLCSHAQAMAGIPWA